jgi:hypothetical protein
LAAPFGLHRARPPSFRRAKSRPQLGARLRPGKVDSRTRRPENRSQGLHGQKHHAVDIAGEKSLKGGSSSPFSTCRMPGFRSPLGPTRLHHRCRSAGNLEPHRAPMVAPQADQNLLKFGPHLKMHRLWREGGTGKFPADLIKTPWGFTPGPSLKPGRSAGGYCVNRSVTRFTRAADHAPSPRAVGIPLALRPAAICLNGVGSL